MIENTSVIVNKSYVLSFWQGGYKTHGFEAYKQKNEDFIEYLHWKKNLVVAKTRAQT